MKYLTVLALFLATSLQAATCENLVKQMPPHTELVARDGNTCDVSWDTYYGYGSAVYLKKFGCSYTGSYKYDVRIRQNEQYNVEGFKYVVFYNCPLRGN